MILMAEQKTTQKAQKKEKKVYHYEIELPEGVTAEYKNGVLQLKGPKGEVSRKMLSRSADINIAAGKMTLKSKITGKRAKKEIHTYRAHMNNMIRGVSEGHHYKLAVISSHFPMTVTLKDGVITIKNYVGEKQAREVKVPSEVKANVSPSEIILESSNKEVVGNLAGTLEKLLQRPNFDNRIFQDGIYIVEKDGKRV